MVKDSLSQYAGLVVTLSVFRNPLTFDIPQAALFTMPKEFSG
jgi:hypothetical protein